MYKHLGAAAESMHTYIMGATSTQRKASKTKKRAVLKASFFYKSFLIIKLKRTTFLAGVPADTFCEHLPLHSSFLSQMFSS